MYVRMYFEVSTNSTLLTYWVHTVAGVTNSMDTWNILGYCGQCRKGLRTMYIDVANNSTFKSGVTIK